MKYDGNLYNQERHQSIADFVNCNIQHWEFPEGVVAYYSFEGRSTPEICFYRLSNYL